ncbi:MAG: TlpA disulfide reductase family protein [Bryobacteraceae bacterium]|jgi:peroxiredoxin
MLDRRAFLTLAGSVPLLGQIKPPKPAPELTIILNSGERLLLSRFRGKVVVLEFLLTTCPHCQSCSAIMQKLYSELGDKFQPLGTAINPNSLTEARLLVPAYISNLGLKFPVGYTPREEAYTWLEAQPAAGPVYFPQLVFIDKRGIIRHYFPGGHEFFRNEEANMRRLILELAAENSTQAPTKGGSKKS